MAKIPETIDPIDASFGDVVGSVAPRAKRAAKPIVDSSQSDFLFYNAGDGTDRIRVFVANEDVWVTQNGMVDIFDIDKSGVSKHLKNVFEVGELNRDSVVAKIATTAADGKTYGVDHYNLDAILSVGYRANSRKAVQFRKWASTILREYLIKGFAMDDDRLKQGKGMFEHDYFDELLERIRDIRASERRFYQKVTDIYMQCSYDYDPESELTKKFYSHAQNKLEYAVTGMTAAEIIKQRADHSLPNMGLTTWKTQKEVGKIRKSDTSVAKGYLAEGEISDLNRLVSMFLDFAENQAAKRKRMSMSDWWAKLDDFLRFNEYQILENYGSIKKTTADKFAANEFDKFKPIQDEAHKSNFDEVVAIVRGVELKGTIS
jgi:hypothetical protein